MKRRVRIPSPLRSYTQGRAVIEAEGVTVAQLLADVDRRHPGLRFRIVDEQEQIRRHIRMYGGTRELRSVTDSLAASEEFHIICALSGG